MFDYKDSAKEKNNIISGEIIENDQKTTIIINKENDKVYAFIVRFFDIVVSFILMVGLLPIWLIIALVIILDDPKGNPLFIQERVGKNGKKFKMIKFRSMYVDAEARLESLKKYNESDGPVFKIKNDPRITRFGKFIRKTSIDEFPQLINVLKGEMSLVGPRPPLPKEVERYTPNQMNRLLIKPGLTCFWQIKSDRHDLKFDEWVELDLKYIRERSLGTNLKIIFKTFSAVFGATGR